MLLSTLVLHERLPAKRVTGALVIVAGLVVIGGEAITTIGVHGVAGDLLFVLAGALFATFGMFLRKWRVAPTRAMVVVSVLSLAILPVYAIFVGFGRMIALGPWENLLQAVMQGLLAGPGAIYLFTRSVVLLGAGRAAVFPTLVPPCVLLIGWIALGSVPTPAAIHRPRHRADGFPAHPTILTAASKPGPQSAIWALQAEFAPTSFGSSRKRMEPTAIQDTLDSLVTTLRVTLRTELNSVWLPIQFGAIALAALAAWGAPPRSAGSSIWSSATMGWPPYLRILVRALDRQLRRAGVHGLHRRRPRRRSAHGSAHPRTYILGVAVDLATAWVVIALVASLIRNPFINRLVSVAAWTVAALSILGSARRHGGRARLARHHDRRPADHAAAGAQDNRAAAGRAVGRDRCQQLPRPARPDTCRAHAVDPGAARQADPHRVMTLAVIIVLSSVGIDLSVLAVFGGAVGVGIGFGLQKIVSNFVSGIILLADKSIKPGDVISVGEQFGWVTNMGARYTSVDTQDGREILIPNEDFVTQRVINWSYSNNG